ncbi:MAG: 2-isopropylmalate synthase, partial [Actinomycetota bacterium]
VAYIMKAEHGFDLPRRLQIEFSKTIQHITEDSGTEITPLSMWTAFEAEYLPTTPRYVLETHELRGDGKVTSVTAQVIVDGEHRTLVGQGNGPISAFVHAIQQGLGVELDVLDYAEHALSSGSEATAVAYVETSGNNGTVKWGLGQDPNIITASFKAVLSALDRQHR